MNGNAVIRRFQFNNVTIASIGAVTTLAVDVAVTAGMVATGDSGFAVPTVEMDEGLPMMIPCVATSSSNIRMFFTNPSAGAIDPADTFDFIVTMFPAVGQLAQTVKEISG